MKINVASIPVGEIGVFKVDIPIVQIGDEETPHLGILCGVHGDETASLVITSSLLRQLSSEKIHGKVSIITAANPFAQATSSRVSLIDFYDLNRTGAGKLDGVFTERLAYKIIEFLSNECSHVIDLHEFEMDTPPMAIYIPSQDDTVDKQILQMIGVFNPVTVWAMNLSASDEVQYKGSLLSVLINTKKIPGFAIETSRLCVVDKQEIENVVDGLLNVSRLLGIITGRYEYICPPPYKRIVKYSDYAGVWLPEKSIMSRVHKGNRIGRVVSLDLVSEREIFATADGILIQVRKPQLVQTGFSLYTIGEVDLFVKEKFERLKQ